MSCKHALIALAVCWAAVSAAANPRDYFGKPDDWFASGEAGRIAANILSHQSDAGGWPKDQSTTAKHFEGNRASIRGTFDNRATTDELRFLARIHAATRDDTVRAAFNRGLDHILDAQYPSGGWPQQTWKKRIAAR